MGLEGRVAFITGAARGQGRAHAVRLAQDGADIVAVDLCAQIPTVRYAMSSPADLDETVRLVEATGRRIVARIADVRSRTDLQAAYDDAVAELGAGADIVIANAGIAPLAAKGVDTFRDAVEVNLVGSYNTVEVAKPHLVERARGAIVLVSSTAGLKGLGGENDGGLGYTASKHGIVGLMRAYARALAPYSIRVNTIHPTGVNTPMVVNESMAAFLKKEGLQDSLENLLPNVPLVEPEDISAAVSYLVSDDARYVTGVTFPVDAGFTIR